MIKIATKLVRLYTNQLYYHDKILTPNIFRKTVKEVKFLINNDSNNILEGAGVRRFEKRRLMTSVWTFEHDNDVVNKSKRCSLFISFIFLLKCYSKFGLNTALYCKVKKVVEPVLSSMH